MKIGKLAATVLLSADRDSTTGVILPSPGATGAISITNVKFSPLASLSLTLPTSLSVTVGAIANLGPDDPADGANPSFAAPTVTGTRTAWYDLATMTVPDG